MNSPFPQIADLIAEAKTPESFKRAHELLKDYFHFCLNDLINEAKSLGIVLSITEEPQLPLMMGNTAMVSKVRSARVCVTNSIPESETWLHTPEAKSDLEEALSYASTASSEESDIDEIQKKLEMTHTTEEQIVEEVAPQKNENILTNLLQKGLVFISFETRYDAGAICCTLASSAEHAEMFERSITGGDMDWSSVSFPTSKSKWYPVGYGDTFELAVEDMVKKILSIPAKSMESFPLAVGLYCASLSHKKPIQEIDDDIDAFCESDIH